MQRPRNKTEEKSLSEKRDMVKALDVVGSENPLKRINLDMSDVGERSIGSFVTSSCVRFFEMLHLPSEFLKSDPHEWDSCPDYQAAAKYVREMKVVNDCAERGMASCRTTTSSSQRTKTRSSSCFRWLKSIISINLREDEVTKLAIDLSPTSDIISKLIRLRGFSEPTTSFKENS